MCIGGEGCGRPLGVTEKQSSTVNNASGIFFSHSDLCQGHPPPRHESKHDRSPDFTLPDVETQGLHLAGLGVCSMFALWASLAWVDLGCSVTSGVPSPSPAHDKGG